MTQGGSPRLIGFDEPLERTVCGAKAALHEGEIERRREREGVGFVDTAQLAHA